INFNPPQANIILPVGISFYTFQTLSYTIDIYLNKFKPWHSFLDYALYVTFFPQLVAGPIVRASDFLQQCKHPKKFLGEQFSWGVSLIILGLFEKIVVADGLLAPITESLYGSEGIPSFSAAWVGTFAFSGQIFCDFAGYSTCAIGAALCLGFKLPINFRFPYAAIGFSDFWRRWHISLSTWLKDYLYIPLGGNRQGKIRTQINLMTTMLLGGLWHGAAWTFVVWGGLHGTYLIGERLLKEKFGNYKIWQTKAAQLGLGLLTFILICVTWVFFRADSFQQAGSIILAMVGLSTETVSITIGKQSIAICLGVISSILGIHWLMRDSTVEQLAIKMPWYWRSIALALMLYGIATLHGEDRSFIYFQF
ncbi:UNVERIFIED_CONTAM: acyltransferase, partial [Euhalothece sp. KZN 001]